MKTRWLIALAALLGASCKTNGRNSALTVTKVIRATQSGTSCTFDTSSDEVDFVSIDPLANSGGMMGVVLQNNLKDPSGVNSLFNADSATFHPHQAVASYEVIGTGTALADQIIPVSGAQIPSGGSGSVAVPFFSPAGTTTLTGEVRVTFRIEGKLDDGSVLKSSEHEYIFLTCPGAGCTGTCL